MVEYQDNTASRHAGGWLVLGSLCLFSCVGFMWQPTDERAEKRANPSRPVPFPRLAIDLNTATPSELSCLEGVGPTLAQRIVDYRSKIGHYQSLDQLDQVPGIGPRLASRLQQSCSVAPTLNAPGAPAMAPAIATHSVPSGIASAEHD